jgi:DMSO/TMAO reductase YedYZ molybdopterin-dependent catalytic subunit
MTDKPVRTRRDLLRGLGGLALLAACADKTAAGRTLVPQADVKGAGSGDIAAFDSAAQDLGPVALRPDVAGDAAATDVLAFQPTIPFITPNAEHYITSCCDTPDVDGGKWSIAVLDKGMALGKFGLGLLESLASQTKEHTLECISAGPSNLAISNALWTGLPLLEVLKAAQIAVPTGRTTVKFTAADDYTTAIPFEDLGKPVWLVWRMNGVPLPPEHGYPARLLVPGRYGMKNPKWITAIEFLDQPYTGFWESHGWSDPAPYLPNTLIRLAPGDMHFQTGEVQIHAGLVHVVGSAFAGQDPIASVEVRVDDGPWQPAVIDYSPGPGIWTVWHFDWAAKTLGKHQVRARCTTTSGAKSVDTSNDLVGLDGYGGSSQVTYEVV